MACGHFPSPQAPPYGPLLLRASNGAPRLGYAYASRGCPYKGGSQSCVWFWFPISVSGRGSGGGSRSARDKTKADPAPEDTSTVYHGRSLLMRNQQRCP
jgi:hypothetical protein